MDIFVQNGKKLLIFHTYKHSSEVQFHSFLAEYAVSNYVKVLFILSFDNLLPTRNAKTTIFLFDNLK